MIQTKLCCEYENTHFVFNNFSPSPENRAVYEIMWNKTFRRTGHGLQYYMPHAICVLNMPADPHSENLILIFHSNIIDAKASMRYVAMYCLSCLCNSFGAMMDFFLLRLSARRVGCSYRQVGPSHVGTVQFKLDGPR